MMNLSRPSNVGVLAADIYVPSRFVAQSDLENDDNCQGKYTVGLGQINMAFTDDREDIGSIILTVVQSLMEKYNINPADVGRLEVGTETLVDKAKSVKTTLMSLFGENTDIEGVTTINACYGGSAALFNTVAWVESSDYDGRYAILVCADIAVYAAGVARPTGGCAAIALLVGPNAPLVLEPGVRASHFLNIYDFYKPHHSEYASVDGKLSQWAYLSSVDTCYARYLSKYENRYGSKIDLSHFDYFTFHSPYNKLAQKGFARLFYVDFMNKLKECAGDSCAALEASGFGPAIPLKDIEQKDSYESRDVENVFKIISNERFNSGLLPSCRISRNIGNSYTASVFCGVVSLLGEFGSDLVGKRVLAFSYGSGSAASVYSYFGRVCDEADPTSSFFGIPPERRRIFSLNEMKNVLDIEKLLRDRDQCSTSEFNDALNAREHAYGKAPWTPTGRVDHIKKGAFYIEEIDEKHRRKYCRKL